MKNPPRQRYQFAVRKGFRVSGDTAARVGQLIIELTDRGAYSPEALVEAASDPHCPAHADFEWDDSKAAHEWRINQARLYQRAITYSLVVTGPRGGRSRVIKMRVAYPFQDADGERHYSSGGSVVKDQNLLDQLKKRALAALESWLNQYRMLQTIGGFVGIFQEIDKVLKTAPRVASRKAARRGRRRRPKK